jgi:tetratricopeptide (TPR) repeat protein
MSTPPASGPAGAPEPQSPQPAEAPRRRFFPRVVRFLWPIITLFQLGIILGLIVVWLRPAPRPEATPGPTEAPESVQPGQPPATEPGASPGAPVNDLPHADDLFREGNYDQALASYQELRDKAVGTARDALQYRVGLCLEGQGKWDRALAVYQGVASRSPNPRAAAAAELGQARVLEQQGRLADARILLAALLLRSAQPALLKQPLLANARYSLALDLARETLPSTRPEPLNAALAYPVIDWPLDLALEWAEPAGGISPSPGGPAPVEIVVQRAGQKLEAARVRASASPIRVADLISRVAEQLGLKQQWTAEATQTVLGRTTTVLVLEMPVASLLDVLTEPLSLAWRIRDSRLDMVREQDLPAEALTAYRMDRARRSLRAAVVADPDNFLAPTADLELANLESIGGDLKAAADGYDRLLRDFPRSPVLVEANYDLGLVQHRRLKYTEAIAAFYRVVDRAPENELASLAYLKIGRLYLEQDQPRQAIRPLRRALALSAGKPGQGAAAVLLAAAHLMNRNPRGANAVLREAKAAILEEPWRPIATFLDSLARYRIGANRRTSQRDASDLLASLLASQQDSLLGPAGALLRGQAYRELALSEQMATLYERTLRDTRAPVAVEMALFLAEYWSQINRTAAARDLLARVVATGDARWIGRAQLGLAEIALREKRPEDALKWCRAMVDQGHGTDLAPILEVMGRAYEQLGNYRLAARCYSGEYPLR